MLRVTAMHSPEIRSIYITSNKTVGSSSVRIVTVLASTSSLTISYRQLRRIGNALQWSNRDSRLRLRYSHRRPFIRKPSGMR